MNLTLDDDERAALKKRRFKALLLATTYLTAVALADAPFVSPAALPRTWTPDAPEGDYVVVSGYLAPATVSGSGAISRAMGSRPALAFLRY